MDLDVDGIPEIDPAIPEPDFFDTDDGAIIPLSAEALNPLPQQLPPENIFDCVGGSGSGLKFDELLEFNEFLVGIESMNKDSSEENKEKVPAHNNEETSKEKTPVSQEPNSKNYNAKSDETASLNDNTSTDKVDDSVISSSGPNTPDSRTSSAVVRLSLPVVPKIFIPKESSKSTKNTTSANTTSSTRTLRGRINEKIKKESRTKRKLSDDDYEVEKEDDEDILQKPSSATRSGRQTRKTARYSQRDSDNDESDDSPEIKIGRKARKVARYGYQKDDSEEKHDSNSNSEVEDSNDVATSLFKRVKKNERKNQLSKGSNYWTDEHGTVHFTDNSGDIIQLKPSSVALIRLSSVEIAKMAEGDEDSMDDDENPFLLEVCIDNFFSAVEAVKGGAGRIELCSSLVEGGLTPSTGFLTLVKEKFKDTPVFVMIRPRGGDFVYTPEEVEIMARDISHYKQIGADGFVFGILTKDCEVDLENCRLLKQMAYPLQCTFHRAFDKVADPLSALETIISLGFQRILTSGQGTTAHTGISVLKQLVKAARGRITILAGAGVNQGNVGDIVKRTGVKEVHGSASRPVVSKMCAPGPSKSKRRGGNKSSGVKMGSTDDSVIKITESDIVGKIVRKGRKNVWR